MILRRPRTLVWQLGLALMAVQAIAVLMLAWYAAVQFRQFNQHQITSELHRDTPLLVQRYQPLIARSHDADAARLLQSMVRDDAQRSGLRITVIGLDGRVLADSEHDPTTMKSHRDRPEVIDAIASGTGTSVRHSPTTGQETIYLAELVRTDGQPAAIVRAALPQSAVGAAPTRVVRLVGAAAIVSLLLTFVVVYLVSRRMGQSISRLADGARRFAAGELTHRIERPGSSELAALADALNAMAGQLSKQIDLLRAQRAEQQAIYQSMTSSVIALNLEQRIISMNRAAEQLLGINGDSARGRLLQEVVRQPQLNQFVADALASEGRATGEFQLDRGQAARVQATSQPLRDARDQTAGVLVLLDDVTQLRRLETIRSDFAANVSHELRTPITNIKGYVETMLDVGINDGQQAMQFLDIIKRNADRLASIVEDLMALARLEQPDAQLGIEKSRASVREIVEAAAAQLDAERQAQETILQIDVPADLVAFVNPQLLEQALSNLLSNAIRYSPAGTTVTISATSTDAEVTIAVIDQGPGIAAEHLPRIFERFYRVDRARSRSMGGTGLGLSIVKHIAMVHGGRVEVHSEVGRGSAFRIVLPKS